MSTIRDLRQRRFVQILIAYLAAGWVAIEVVDQLVDNELLPAIAYRLVLLWYIAGLPGAAVVAWFHGEQGRQRAPKSEIAFLTLLVLGLVGFSARTVGSHLESVRAMEGAALGDLPVERVAVLYLEDRSRSDTLGHLADAFTEDLIDVLSRVPELDVVSAGGVRPYRDADAPDLPTIANALGAGTLVQGSLGESDDGVEVDLALVDGASGAVFRRTSLEVPVPVFVEGGTRLAREAAGLLRERLGEEVRLRETRNETDNTAAWSRLQRAQRLMKDAEVAINHEHDPGRADTLYAEADGLLEEAAAMDTTWVRPMALRSQVAYRRSRIPTEFVAGIPFALDAIRYGDEAVARDGTDAAALEARGTARYWRWLVDPDLEPPARDALFRRARADLEAAVEQDRHRASAYSTLSHLYYNDPEAPGLTTVLVTAQRAYEEDAYLESAEQVLWRIHTAALDIGQFPPAVNACEDGRARFPDSFRFRLCGIRLMATPAMEPDVDEAWRLVAQTDSLVPERQREFYHTENQLFMAVVLDRAGLPDSARAVLARASRDADNPTIDPHRELWLREAIVRSRIGQTEEAVALVERYLIANPGHRFDEGHGLSWWWRALEPEPAFRRLLAMQAQDDH
jgi:TolB-like protein/tetratricopeptide (TPR) repeat protein